MISFWPFKAGSGSGRIQDMHAPQMAEAALKSLQQSGRTPLSLRLVYRTLELDPFNPQGLLILSELYRSRKKGTRPTGDEILAGIVVEYAMDPKSTVPAAQKRLFDKARLDIMTSWGFITPRGTEFEVDHLGYMGYINELMAQVRSVGNGFRIAMVKLGVQAGVLDPAKGVPTRTYQEWLRADASTLRL
jgi:hypothetical protein